MTKQKAMEWAKESQKAWFSANTESEGFEAIANLFMEATEGLYRIGERVEARLINGREWEGGVVRVGADGWWTVDSSNVRPLTTKRPKTKRELAKDIGWWVEDVSLETYQRMATDLGIDLETEDNR